MTIEWISYICLAIGLSCALVGGVFQSFSDFVMRALVMAKPTSGIEAMQLINRTVFRSAFLAMFMALAPITFGLGVYAMIALEGFICVLIVTGAAVYLASVFLVTILGNVPMNNRLRDMSLHHEDTAAYWQVYGRVWTRWNHIRTLGSVAAALCFLIAAMVAG